MRALSPFTLVQGLILSGIFYLTIFTIHYNYGIDTAAMSRKKQQEMTMTEAYHDLIYGPKCYLDTVKRFGYCMSPGERPSLLERKAQLVAEINDIKACPPGVNY